MRRDSLSHHLFPWSTVSSIDFTFSDNGLQSAFKLAEDTPSCVWLRSRLPIRRVLVETLQKRRSWTRFRAWLWSKLLIPSGISTSKRWRIGIVHAFLRMTSVEACDPVGD
jgi:hypothetical protein